MRTGLGWTIAGAVTCLLFWIVWRQGFAAPSPFRFGMDSVEGEAAYCLAAAERAAEITRGQGDSWLESHLDEQMAFWVGRVGSARLKARISLARDAAAPGVNEGAHLHLVIQECGHWAVAYFGHEFSLPP